MDESRDGLYQQRAQIVLKLLDTYIDKPQTSVSFDLTTSELPILVNKKLQEPIANFLRSTLQCKVTYGKDRFGQLNGYLMVCLDNDRLNQTGLFQGALVLQKLKIQLPNGLTVEDDRM